ncbi:MAG TPA: serine/threonine-protein kinase [Thermoanaerobaculia bacterium]|nr:serine/threonine-protein kinase [Thermoanaerobaculia bacterium]
MDAERWQRVRSLFAAAIEREPDEWPAWLKTACGEDLALREEVRSLLAAHREGGSLLPEPSRAAGADEQPTLDPLVGQRLGPYEVLQRLGGGGMGVVYLAARVDGQFKKRVALKVLKPGMDSEEILRRFRTERQILAALDHPNIGRLLDGGTTDRGLPYFVMEHVNGLPITDYCDRGSLSIDERLRLFRTVCAAVQFAHQNLVIHRDLKPGNILVGADGTPKLLDFGIAKLLNPELMAQTVAWTSLGTHPLTLEYASPEQIRGGHVTTASDVYSLGVVLYELLTGRHPFRTDGCTPEEMARRITEVEPERPSSAAGGHEPPGDRTCDRATVGVGEGVRRGGRRRLARRLAGDLDTIVLTALQKEPRLRYGTVERLSEDIRRFLEGLPVLARKPTVQYRAGKFVRRHRLGVAVAVTAFLALVLFGAGMTALSLRLARERERAELAQRRAEQVTTLLTEIFEVSDPWKSSGETVTARAILDSGARRLVTKLTDEPLVRSDLMETIGVIYQRLGLPDRAQPLLEASLATRLQLFGEQHSKVADALSGLASVQEDKGEFQAAIDLVHRALAIRRRQYGPQHEMVARSLHDLGLLLRRQGDLASAEDNLRAALSLRRRLPQPSQRDVAESLNGLGVVLWESGRYGEAERVTREALAIRREVFGRNHVEVATTVNLLATIMAADGDWPQAEALMREALAMRRRLYQGNHPKIAESLNNLGALLKDRGNPDDAEALFREALTMRRELFGEEHLSVATTLENLGWIALNRDYSAAARLQQESLAIRTKILGQNHRLVSDSLVALATVLERQGDFGGAEKTLREALRIRREVLGNQHLQVAVNLERLASLLVHRDRFGEAETLAVEAAAIVRRMEPVVPEHVAEAERVLANCLVAQRRYAEAESLLLKSLETLRSRPGEAAPSTRQVLADLASLYESWGKPEQAAHWRAGASAKPRR